MNEEESFEDYIIEYSDSTDDNDFNMISDM